MPPSRHLSPVFVSVSLVLLQCSTGVARAATDGGRCDAPAPAVAKQPWRHSHHAKYATSLGAPNHRIRDLLLAPGQTGVHLRGRFTYGAADKDLEHETIEVWFQRCPAWERWATLTTDHDGVVQADVPADLPPGTYQVRMIVAGDLSFAEGTIAVWRPGTQVIVSDIDGTLTTGDGELFRDLAGGRDAAMYADANTVMQSLARKGYRLVYLTGRAQLVNRYTRGWLAKNGFPSAPLLLTEDGSQALPGVAGVGGFKAGVLNDLQARLKVRFVAGYGNAIGRSRTCRFDRKLRELHIQAIGGRTIAQDAKMNGSTDEKKRENYR